MLVQIKRDRGTALVEILIVIALSSLLIGLFLHADLVVNRSIMRWARRSGLEQAAINLGRQIRRDTDYCDSLHMRNSSDFEVYRSGTPVAVYSFYDNTITRNGRVLLPEKIMVSEYSLNPLNSKMYTHSAVLKFHDQSTLVLTITLQRDELATQTILIPVRSYTARQIE